METTAVMLALSDIVIPSGSIVVTSSDVRKADTGSPTAIIRASDSSLGIVNTGFLSGVKKSNDKYGGKNKNQWKSYLYNYY